MGLAETMELIAGAAGVAADNLERAGSALSGVRSEAERIADLGQAAPTALPPAQVVDAGARPSSPAGVRPSSPAGARPGSSAGARPASPAGVRPGSPAGVRPGSGGAAVTTSTPRSSPPVDTSGIESRLDRQNGLLASIDKRLAGDGGAGIRALGGI